MIEWRKLCLKAWHLCDCCDVATYALVPNLSLKQGVSDE